ncbi:MAG: hypothetical protein ABIS47_13980 [Acidimicrobiales bacterium]
MGTSWRARFRAGASTPSLTVGAEVLAGPVLRRGAERWAAAFRSAGLVPGDRLVTLLPTSPCLAQVLLAGLWEGLTLAPARPGTDPAAAADAADATAAVVAGRLDLGWAWPGEGADGPEAGPTSLRPAGPPTPLARLLCTGGPGDAWPALLDDNLEHAVDGVLGALQPRHGRWLSVLPWHTPAGLLLDLLPAMLSADAIMRPSPDDEPSLPDVANSVDQWQPTHTILPLELVRRLWQRWGSLDPLRGLVDGLASGPGLDPPLATHLATTRLRTHRGAPELSCLVTIGEPGIWRPGTLGRPVGCVLTAGPGDSLVVRGRPVAGGRWLNGHLQLVDRRAPVVVAFA